MIRKSLENTWKTNHLNPIIGPLQTRTRNVKTNQGSNATNTIRIAEKPVIGNIDINLICQMARSKNMDKKPGNDQVKPVLCFLGHYCIHYNLFRNDDFKDDGKGVPSKLKLCSEYNFCWLCGEGSIESQKNFHFFSIDGTPNTP